MPNMNSYTDINNHKGIDNCKYHNKNTCPLPNSFQTTGVIYQANIDCDIGGYKQNVILTHVKQHLNIVSGIIRSCSTWLNIKTTGNHQKSFGKSKSSMEHQKLHTKLSE